MTPIFIPVLSPPLATNMPTGATAAMAAPLDSPPADYTITKKRESGLA